MVFPHLFLILLRPFFLGSNQMSFQIHMSDHVASLLESLQLFFFALRIMSKIPNAVCWAPCDLAPALSALTPLFPPLLVFSSHTGFFLEGPALFSGLWLLHILSLPTMRVSLYQPLSYLSLNYQPKYHFPFSGKFFLTP